jgi:hypothetical protein
MRNTEVSDVVRQKDRVLAGLGLADYVVLS